MELELEMDERLTSLGWGKKGMCTTDIKKLADEGCTCNVCLPQLSKERGIVVAPTKTDGEWVKITHTTLLNINDKVRKNGTYKVVGFSTDFDAFGAMEFVVNLEEQGGTSISVDLNDIADGVWEVCKDTSVWAKIDLNTTICIDKTVRDKTGAEYMIRQIDSIDIIHLVGNHGVHYVTYHNLAGGDWEIHL